LNDQLDNYRQHWQYIEQKQIMIKMAGKLPASQAMASANIMSAAITTVVAVITMDAKEIMDAEVADKAE
jgi:hypothetical protein